MLRQHICASSNRRWSICRYIGILVIGYWYLVFGIWYSVFGSVLEKFKHPCHGRVNRTCWPWRSPEKPARPRACATV